MPSDLVKSSPDNPCTPARSCKSLPLPTRTAEQRFSLHGESFHKRIRFPLKFVLVYCVVLDSFVGFIVATQLRERGGELCSWRKPSHEKRTRSLSPAAPGSARTIPLRIRPSISFPGPEERLRAQRLDRSLWLRAAVFAEGIRRIARRSVPRTHR